jgi:Holliday junction DNA helicase RuvA
MIASLAGQLIYKSDFLKKDNFLIINVAGVGYKVFALNRDWEKLKIGQDTEVFVYTQVAEGVLDLYGFTSREEWEFFEILLGISGIGPRSAMDILGKAKVADLRQAAQSGQPEILSKVSGIGPKTAQKIVAGLKDKLGSLDGGASNWDRQFGDALEALVGLGYSAGQAREALAQCRATEMGEKVKEALKILGRK